MVQTSICCSSSGTFHVSDITCLTSHSLMQTVRSLQTLLEDYKVWRVTVLHQKWVSTPLHILDIVALGLNLLMKWTAGY